MKKTTKIRIFGGLVIMFNLWLVGSYNIIGIPLFLMTFGFAVGMEIFVVRMVYDTSRLRDKNLELIPPPPEALKNASMQPVLVPETSVSINLPEPVERVEFEGVVANQVSMLNEAGEVGDDMVWVQVLAEYDSAARRLGLWARVFASAEGNESLAKARYLQERVDEVLEQRASSSKAVERHLAEQSEVARKKIEQFKHAFLAGKRLDIKDISFLAMSSNTDSSLSSLSERFQGATLLHLCVRHGLEEEVATLLKNGANPNARDGNGQTAVPQTS